MTDPLEKALRAKLGLPDADDDEQANGPAPVALNSDALLGSIAAKLGIPTTSTTEL